MKLIEIQFQIASALSRWGLIAGMRGSMIFSRFLLVVFISHYLDLAALGLFGLILGAVAMVPAFIALGMAHVVMRDAVTMSPAQLVDALRHYWAYTLTIYFLALSAASLAAYGAILSPIWIIVIALTLFEHLGSDFFLLLSNLERAMLAQFSAFLRSVAWIVVYLPLALYFPALRTLGTLLLFWLIGSAASVVVFAVATRSWPWRDACKTPLRPMWIRSLARSSVVLYINDLSFVASQYMDRYLVTLYLGLELTGVYILYWSTANAIYTFVSMTVLQHQRPLLIKAHHHGRAAQRKQHISLARTTALSAASIGLVVAVAFVFLVPLLRQPLANANLASFWLIVVGMVVRCIADWGAMALFAARRDRIMTATNLAAITALALFQAALLPVIGLAGAGTALLITFGIVAYWRYRLVFTMRWINHGAN